MRPRLSKTLLTTTALLALGAMPGAAGPNGPTVVGGSATVTGAGTSSVIVNQSSGSAIINWNTFNVGVGESVRFNQPSSSAIALNRVTGGLGPSEILGTITANGRVFIINADGVLFGAGAVVNTAGFLASTHDIRNSDFMAGRMNFTIPGRPDASIVNLGRITATSGGFAALVAPGVRNSGTITATLGTVGLAASGNGFTLDLYGDRLITLSVNDQVASKVIDVATGQPLKSLVTNTGKLSANGGRVELTAAAARTVVDSVINTSGIIQANSIGRKNGMIVLGGATGSSKPTGAPAQTIRISGTISAAGKKKGTTGGTIVVSGEDIKLASAVVDASGRAGGGKVMIGGDWAGGRPGSSVDNQSAKLESYAIPTATTVSVDAGTTINASARDSGNGGKVVLWSDQQTTFAGTILAQGGANGGNGGFVETSSHDKLAFAGNVDTRAPQGKIGTLLLDPTNLTIVSSCIDGCPSSEMTAAQLVALLNSNDTVISAGQNVFVNAGVTWTTGSTLTISAGNNIELNAAISTSIGGLTLNAGNLITAPSSVNVGTFTLQSGTWSQVSATLPEFIARDFRIAGGTFIRALGGDGSNGSPYQIADIYGLQGIGSAGMLNQNYILANNIDGTGTTNWNSGAGFAPIGSVSSPFTGTFDGRGNTVSNLTIAPDDSNTNNIGVFATIGVGGIVRNLTLDHITVSANPGFDGLSQFVGTLAGQNAGLIENVAVTNGIVNGMPNNVELSGIIAGGLVGQNGILTKDGPQPGTITQSTAAVNVAVGNAVSGEQENNVGGLAGYNYGTISSSSATGNVAGGDNSNVGGLAGRSDGSITSSYATGDVTGGVFTGGLVGRNAGAITDSHATGTVSSGNEAPSNSVRGGYGGLVGLNDTTGTISQSFATGALSLLGPISGYLDGGGLVGQNRGDVASSYATGSVYSQHSSADHTYLGGLVGWNFGGSIEGSHASGTVTGVGAFGDGGGLVGVNELGTIFQSYATGTVNMTGTSSSAGGLVGINNSSIEQAFSTGSASVSDGGSVGGLVGSNAGSILQAYATGSVTGGINSTVGGLVGSNSGGSINETYAIGKLSAGAGSTVGGLIGTSVEGDIRNSYWDTQTTGASTSAGGPGAQGVPTVGLIAALPAGFNPSVWTIQPDPSYPYFAWQPNNTIPITNEPVPNIPGQQTQIINNLTNTVTFASLNTSPVVTTQNNGVRQPQFPPSLPPGAQPPPTGQTTDLFQQRVFDVPPLTETRFVADQVLLQIKCDIAVPRLEEEVRRLGLELMASQQLCTTTGTTALQFRITDGKTVRDVIRLLASVQIVAIAQPIYIYVAGQETAADPTVPASRGDPTQQQGDAAQYILQKLRIPDVHRIVRGTNVPIAVIDSEIDAAHPDLAGMVVQRFSAVGAPEKPHSHGTGMAGAIASHQRLMGMAPSSRIYAVHAFSPKAATAESTTYAILKGLDWATTQGVRIINMSFAGPKDPSLERAIKVAYDKGIVLIAAAGNAGPTSPPLYPGADPNVIAVTATDAQDKIFTGANRGKYVSVAAPGVDILVPAPENAYQLTTGTSVAAAEVSGIVALLLERNPRLTPVDVRRILTGSARRLAPGDRTDEFGSGLVDPLKALQAADPRLVTSSPPLRQR